MSKFKSLLLLIASLSFFSPPAHARSSEDLFTTRKMMDHARVALTHLRELRNPAISPADLALLDLAWDRAQPYLVLVDWNDQLMEPNQGRLIRCDASSHRVHLQFERWKSLDSDLKRNAAGLYALECLVRTEEVAQNPNGSWTAAYLAAVRANFNLNQLLSAPLQLQSSRYRQLISMRYEMESLAATRESPQSSRALQMVNARGRKFVWHDFPVTFSITAYDRYDFYRYEANRKGQWLLSASRTQYNPDPNTAHSFRTVISARDFNAHPSEITLDTHSSRELTTIDFGRRIVSRPADESWSPAQSGTAFEIFFEEPRDGFVRTFFRNLSPISSNGSIFDAFQGVSGVSPETVGPLDAQHLPGALRGDWRQRFRSFTDAHSKVIDAKMTLAGCLADERTRPSTCSALHEDYRLKYALRDQQFETLITLSQVNDPRLRRPPPPSHSDSADDFGGGRIIRRDRVCWIIGNRLVCN